MATEPLPFIKTEEYNLFRSWAALKAITTLKPTEKLWRFYECGPKEITPLVCIPGISGGANSFWRQMLLLCQAKGYHIISVDFPPYWSHNEFVVGFEDFLDSIKVKTIHLLGCSLGGFLAQLFAEKFPKRVHSIILTNSFSSTSTFAEASPCMDMFRIMPNFLLKRSILKNFPQGEQDCEITRSIDFMVDQLQGMPQSYVASRLTLNCLDRTVDHLAIPEPNITIIDALDEVATPPAAREQLYQTYPDAKKGFMKKGGNFPYLACPDEFNVQLEVHLRHVIQDRSISTATSQQNPVPQPEMDEEERQRQEQWRQEVIAEENEARNQQRDQPKEEEAPLYEPEASINVTPSAPIESTTLKGDIEIEIGTGTDPNIVVSAPVPELSVFSREFVPFSNDGNLLDGSETDVAASAQMEHQTTVSDSVSDLLVPAVEATSEVPNDPNLAWPDSQQQRRHNFDEIPL